MRDQVFAFPLDKSCNYIFDIEKKCLSFSLKKHQKIVVFLKYNTFYINLCSSLFFS